MHSRPSFALVCLFTVFICPFVIGGTSLFTRNAYFEAVEDRKLQIFFMSYPTSSVTACCVFCNGNTKCVSVNFKAETADCQLSTETVNQALPELGWTVFTRHQPTDWSLVFRLTPRCGSYPYSAWISGVDVTTDDVNCMDITSTNCTKHYRHPDVAHWNKLSIKEVKYALYKDGAEVANVIFDAQDSDNLVDWFDPSKLLDSTWTDLTTTPTNYFSIEGIAGRVLYINNVHGGCPNDQGFTMVVTSVEEVCPYDTQSSYPVILYARGNTKQIIATGDIGEADFAAIFIRR